MVQVFSCKFCKIFKNTFFLEHLRWLLLIVTQIYEVFDFIILLQTIIILLRKASGHAGGRSPCPEFVNAVVDSDNEDNDSFEPGRSLSDVFNTFVNQWYEKKIEVY